MVEQKTAISLYMYQIRRQLIQYHNL